MKLHLAWIALVAVVLGARDFAEAAKRPLQVAPPPPRNSLADEAGGEAVLRALDKAEYRFTPEVKAVYLDWNRSRALESIRAAGYALPDDFLAWVDGDPVVAATIFGSPAALQRLVLLRSLDIDLGAETVRKNYAQFALALAASHAGLVDVETLSNPERGIHLEPRARLQLEIKRYPMAPVDTRAQDRELDLEDHIINFLEDHPVAYDVEVAKEVNDQTVQVTEQHTRPLHAHEVMSNPQHQLAFNEYMKAHGQDVTLDCGDSINPKSRKARNIMRAYKMFRKAYQEKGRIPKAGDPRPTPAEIAAYVIRNDQFRFPDGSKRKWPLFPLDSPWSVLKYLAKDDMPLRDREYVWRRYRDGRKVETYGKYIGKIAHSPAFVEARNLRPYDYASGSYPVLVRDGGVCGVTSNIGRRAHIALGVPAVQASQPGHACYVKISGNLQGGFGLSIKQSISTSRLTKIRRYGSFRHEVCRLSAVNYGLPEMLDAMIVHELVPLLPTTVAAKQRLTLLRSGWERNPYYLPLVLSIQAQLTEPAALVRYYFELEQTLAVVKKPRCYQGALLELVRGNLNSRLAQPPPPSALADINVVRTYLANRSDALWIKYELLAVGLPALQERMAEELKASVQGTRNQGACARLAERLTRVGSAIEDPKLRGAWAEQLLPIIAGKAAYQGRRGSKRRTLIDPCEQVLLKMNPPSSPD